MRVHLHACVRCSFSQCCRMLHQNEFLGSAVYLICALCVLCVVVRLLKPHFTLCVCVCARISVLVVRFHKYNTGKCWPILEIAFLLYYLRVGLVVLIAVLPPRTHLFLPALFVLASVGFCLFECRVLPLLTCTAHVLPTRQQPIVSTIWLTNANFPKCLLRVLLISFACFVL